MFERLRILPLWLRISSVVFLYFVIWANFSIPPLVANQPEAFQAAGSIVVAWGILFLGLQRLRYEKTIRTAEEIVIASHLQKIEAHRLLTEKRLNYTFDCYALQIYQISKHLGVPNPIGPHTQFEAEELAKSLQERHGETAQTPAPQEDQAAQSAIAQLRDYNNEIRPWISVIFKAELAFIVFGTIQWGYGNIWVAQLHHWLSN